MIYRHGDVFLMRRDDIDISKLRRAKDNVLALGESTGHRHEITLGEVYVGEEGELFIVAPEAGGRIEHLVGDRQADHAPIDLEPGVYEYVPQREYTPEGWERVVD